MISKTIMFKPTTTKVIMVELMINKLIVAKLTKKIKNNNEKVTMIIVIMVQLTIST
jgi:uncharacterized membrane protein YjfL (UPF0719 family)